MRKLAIAILAAGAAWAATQKNPPNCSSRPCTYTITCASATCTAAESAELQAAINDSQLGDTIKLEAGRTFIGPTNGFQITQRPGSSGYLTITTTGQLPPDGARITPHWRSQLPTLKNGGTPVVLQFVGSDSGPAEHVYVRGIRFTGCGQGLIRSGGTVTSDAGQPNDIVLDQILIENENWSIQCGTFLQVNARELTYKNSWAAGSMFLGGEKQSLTSTNGPGPLLIENNYLADNNGENIMFGGTGPQYRNLGISATVRLNALINHQERVRYSRWAPRMTVFSGRVISPSGAGSPTFQATNSGITGTTEPSWPSSMGATVNDNGIVWKLVSTGNTHLTVKNNFEIKNGVNVKVYANHLSGMWVDGQYEMVVYKLANCPSGSGTGCQCVPGFSGLVNTNGTAVTSADGKPIPNIHNPTTGHGADPFAITIAGTTYTIASFVDDYNLTLTSSAGTKTNASYTYGQANCRPAWNKDNTFESNFVENGPLAWQTAQWTNGLRSQIGNILVRNNIFRSIDPSAWSANGGGVWNAQYYFWFGAFPKVFRFENNTLVAAQNAARAGILLDAGGGDIEKGVIRRNIWVIAGGSGIVGGTPTAAESQSMLNSHLCDGSPCTTEEWDKNVISGANLTRYSVGTHWNLCSAATGCTPPPDFTDPANGPLFEDYAAGVYRVRETHPAGAAGVGADFLSVPMIRSHLGLGPHVITTSTSALFSYWVHAPQASTPCSVEVSTTQDMDNLVPVPNLNALSDAADGVPQPEAARRYILVTGLSPSTRYYYRLHCGAIHEGSFQTSSTAPSGSRPLAVTFTAQAGGSYRLEWGTSYSRASDTLSGGGFGSSVNCAAGATCTVSANASAGLVFYRAVGPVNQPVEVGL
jgi:hypothetical protein